MRTLLFLLVAVLAVALVSCKRPWPKKRFRCQSDADCKESQCCIKGKLFSYCFRKFKEGDLCGFTGVVAKRFPKMCGCSEGLVCKKSRYIIKRCTKEEGSGDDDFFDYQ